MDQVQIPDQSHNWTYYVVSQTHLKKNPWKTIKSENYSYIFSAFENTYTMMTKETFNTRGREFYIGIHLIPTPLDREKC